MKPHLIRAALAAATLMSLTGRAKELEMIQVIPPRDPTQVPDGDLSKVITPPKETEFNEGSEDEDLDDGADDDIADLDEDD